MLPSLRRDLVYRVLGRAIRKASRDTFRIIHYSVQSNHIHLVVEASDERDLSRGASGFAIRAARALNRRLGRKGRIWGDRYHARALRTPREVRNVLVYVLTNWKKHVARARGIDPRSSANWFDGWVDRSPDMDDQPPTASPETWLLKTGWRRRGLIRITEGPNAPP